MYKVTNIFLPIYSFSVSSWRMFSNKTRVNQEREKIVKLRFNIDQKERKFAKESSKITEIKI